MLPVSLISYRSIRVLHSVENEFKIFFKYKVIMKNSKTLNNCFAKQCLVAIISSQRFAQFT